MLQRKVFLDLWKGTILTSSITGGFVQHWNVKEIHGKDNNLTGFIDGICLGSFIGIISPVILATIPCYIGYNTVIKYTSNKK